jgi:PncC family amidohydrolase
MERRFALAKTHRDHDCLDGARPAANDPGNRNRRQDGTAMFLNEEQTALAEEIASLLTARNETVCVAEGTTGGLVSAALLSVPGASRYFAGGGVLYTRKSRVALAGIPAELLENYAGTTQAIMDATADSMRRRLEATWCIAESGAAGPTAGRTGQAGRTLVAVAGPTVRFEVIETGLDDRVANMTEFTTRALRTLRDAIAATG